MKNTSVNKSDLYDVLYEQAGRLLKAGNPCNIRIENNKKVCNGHLASCCAGCKHLGAEGCTVEALSCKLWLCREVGSHPMNAQVVIGLDALRRVGYSLGLHTHGYGKGFRASKAESLEC